MERIGIFFHYLPAVSSGLQGHQGSIPDDRLGIPPVSLQGGNTLLSPSYTLSLLGNSKYPSNLYHLLQEDRYRGAGE